MLIHRFALSECELLEEGGDARVDAELGSHEGSDQKGVHVRRNF
jgi:hypothetical protein